ncbi:DUF952 domain-containing protein [Streptomyces sp. G5(2025)]|uniref:DUF952 domain-containing protein n=1 Tax=Streptomyces sp. G5(2025) TaxID=3406628 RepID=UPI003C26DB84
MLFHAARLDRWLAEPHQPYSAPPSGTHGTVHCSADQDALLAVVSRFLRDVEGPLVALVIDETKLDAPVSRGPVPGSPSPEALIPQIHGPVNRDAVVALMDVERDSDGRARALVPRDVAECD